MGKLGNWLKSAVSSLVSNAKSSSNAKATSTANSNQKTTTNTNTNTNTNTQSGAGTLKKTSVIAENNVKNAVNNVNDALEITGGTPTSTLSSLFGGYTPKTTQTNIYTTAQNSKDNSAIKTNNTKLNNAITNLSQAAEITGGTPISYNSLMNDSDAVRNTLSNLFGGVSNKQYNNQYADKYSGLSEAVAAAKAGSNTNAGAGKILDAYTGNETTNSGLLDYADFKRNSDLYNKYKVGNDGSTLAANDAYNSYRTNYYLQNGDDLDLSNIDADTARQIILNEANTKNYHVGAFEPGSTEASAELKDPSSFLSSLIARAGLYGDTNLNLTALVNEYLDASDKTDDDGNVIDTTTRDTAINNAISLLGNAGLTGNNTQSETTTTTDTKDGADGADGADGNTGDTVYNTANTGNAGNGFSAEEIMELLNKNYLTSFSDIYQNLLNSLDTWGSELKTNFQSYMNQLTDNDAGLLKNLIASMLKNNRSANTTGANRGAQAAENLLLRSGLASDLSTATNTANDAWTELMNSYVKKRMEAAEDAYDVSNTEKNAIATALQGFGQNYNLTKAYKA